MDDQDLNIFDDLIENTDGENTDGENQTQIDSQPREFICPVVAAIQKLRSGGWTNDSESDSHAVVRIMGGSEISSVCDDVGFYVNVASLELARFELKRPSLQECQASYKKYAMILGCDYSDILCDIIKSLSVSTILSEQLSVTSSLTRKLFDTIDMRLSVYARRGDNISITLTWPPNICINGCTIDPPTNINDINDIIDLIKSILEFMNSLDIKMLCSKIIDAPSIDEAVLNHIDIDQSWLDQSPRKPHETPMDLDQYLANMRVSVTAIEEVAKKATQLETHMCQLVDIVIGLSRYCQNVMLSLRK